VTTVSEFLRRRVVAAVPGIAARCVVLPMPLEVEHFERGRQAVRATPPRILYAGNLVASKGVDVLIRAAGHLLRDGHPVQLRILGEGPDTERLTTLVKSLALEGIVEILPFVGQEQMPAEYGAATVTVLPTRGDAEGLVRLGAPRRHVAAGPRGGADLPQRRISSGSRQRASSA